MYQRTRKLPRLIDLHPDQHNLSFSIIACLLSNPLTRRRIVIFFLNLDDYVPYWDRNGIVHWLYILFCNIASWNPTLLYYPRAYILLDIYFDHTLKIQLMLQEEALNPACMYDASTILLDYHSLKKKERWADLVRGLQRIYARNGRLSPLYKTVWELWLFVTTEDLTCPHYVLESSYPLYAIILLFTYQ